MPFTSKVSLLLFCLVARSLAQEPAAIEARLYSRLLVVGEQTLMSVEVRNASVIDWPDSPRASPLALKRQGKTHITRNGRIHEVFEYTVTAFQPGVYVIPPFQLKTPYGSIQSKPLSLRVFPVADLETKGISLKPNVVPYLTGIFVENKSPYLGETQTVEAKLYVPHSAPHMLRLHEGQVINMEKDGIAAWRFTTSRRPTGVLNYDGHNFAVYTYRSSINALREGDLQLGPGKAEPIFERRTTGRGGFQISTEAIKVEFPPQSITVRPLPPGAPTGFEGAVGNFSLEVSPTAREIKFGDTLTIEAKVTGDGNIDQFPGPVLVDPEENWKQFDMIAKPPGSERRSSSGTVEFSQVIRPIKKVPAVPPYRFIFFDAVLEQYRSLETPPQPITITGSSVLAAAEDNPGLKFLTPAGTKPIIFGEKKKLPFWLWQIAPALLLAGILGIIFRQRMAGRHLNSQPAREFAVELEKVRRFSSDRVAFYREATKFATRWRSGEGFEEIFETRDEICFLPESEPEPVPEPERNRVINLLKSLSPMLLAGMIFLLQSGSLQALDQDPQKAKMEIMAAMESNPAPEHFYNLALCEKELGNPGEAALWAYRFKAQGRDAGEILKELPGVRGKERKGTDWVSYFHKSFYFQIALAGAWAFVIFLVALKLPRGKLRLRLLPVCGLTAALALSLGGVAWLIYPDEISFEPLHSLSVVTKETPLLSQAFDGGNVMRENLNGSLCKTTATRTGFSHVVLPGGLAGWVQKDSVQAIAP